MKNKIYVAVIHTKDKLKSNRRDNTWACTLSEDMDEAIEEALKLRDIWEAQGYGPYSIGVGELNYGVALIKQWRLKKL